jgi:hypothetical protein
MGGTVPKWAMNMFSVRSMTVTLRMKFHFTGLVPLEEYNEDIGKEIGDYMLVKTRQEKMMQGDTLAERRVAVVFEGMLGLRELRDK